MCIANLIDPLTLINHLSNTGLNGFNMTRYLPNGINYSLIVDFQSFQAIGVINEFGDDVGDTRWIGPRPAKFNDSLDNLKATVRDNFEGFVVYWPEENFRLKVKLDEYLRLHKVLTGVSARTIWQALKNGDSLEAWIENVPDEFAEFIRATSRELTTKFDEIAIKVKRDYATIMASFNGFAYPDRKQFAMEALKYKDKDILFLMFDERDWHDRVWKQVYPEAEAPAFKVVM